MVHVEESLKSVCHPISAVLQLELPVPFEGAPEAPPAFVAAADGSAIARLALPM